ncbi:acyl-CoA dehydrogenase family protein [Actinocrispum wychmicini]|uniref:Alkylation response protein AidB-like acyl-CoA dehydrogenase n=1 Tax=Actinocrispum wychmicini TaxID=1213861 RepID=A0A4R2IJG9_9PSEU|nr:acyl-CoA dehydrogenase family protein [Actinocrispum wychmicini]TCO44727.1 alkylation response protein AidB-like acyl-CoA dehydrogenase [Actinocrispum wychmicini]
MDFAFSAEQEMLRVAAKEFLAEQYPLDGVPAIVDGSPGWQPESWKQVAELGWTDPELTLLDHVVLFEETGAALLPAPLFSTLALALPAVQHDAELAAAVSAGDLRLSLAWAESGRPQGLRDTDLATSVSADGRVTGTKILVPDAACTDALVVVTAGAELRLVRTADATVTPLSTSDLSRRLYTVEFADAPSRSLTSGHAVLAAIENRAFVLAAAEALGVGRRAVDDGVAHASSRSQFGKVIGTYQAVSNQLVDSYAALELARSLTYWAAWSVQEEDPQADVACAAAKSAAAEAAVAACEHVIQVLGGVGMTWEHVLHRLYKRAQWLAAFGGGARDLRARIADAIIG